MKLRLIVVITSLLIVEFVGMKAVADVCDNCPAQPAPLPASDPYPACGSGCTPTETFINSVFLPPVSGETLECSGRIKCSGLGEPEKQQEFRCWVTITTVYTQENYSVTCSNPPPGCTCGLGDTYARFLNDGAHDIKDTDRWFGPCVEGIIA